MMNMKRSLLLGITFGLCMSQWALAQSNTALPTDADLMKAKKRTAEAFSKIPESRMVQSQVQAKPVMPKVEAMPKPAIPAPDIAAIAEKYKNLGQPQSRGKGLPNDLMVFVSLSIPKAALERIVDQAEKTGAVLVFRGLKNDSMNQMAVEVRNLIGNRNVGAVIHPPAFQQFSISKVPAVVMAKADAGNVLEDGCAIADTFVKVSGDVTIEYALEYIDSHSQQWAPLAKRYLEKLKPEVLK